VGLGTGTQLALAIAQGVLASQGIEVSDPVRLAMLAGRAPRSGIGIHGFALGGFLVDQGKDAAAGVAPLLQRCHFPDAWRVVLLRQGGTPGFSGEREREAFARLAAGEAEAGEYRRRRLVDHVLVPALRHVDFDGFAEALYEYNRLAGEAFASVQGGPYASPAVAEVVAQLRGHGVRGVGQSSWGPTVFALARDEDEARALAQWVTKIVPQGQSIAVTRGSNHGAITSPVAP
jgi:beta-RFAP synthase